MAAINPLIPRKRVITKKNNLLEVVAWKVSLSGSYLEGIKYSFSFIHNSKRIIAFDNFNKEGHHKHYFDKKESYNFESLEKTEEIFFELVKKFEEEENDKDK
ncbi:MAG: DUF6516 family protein [Nanoarchaeota archaeon]